MRILISVTLCSPKTFHRLSSTKVHTALCDIKQLIKESTRKKILLRVTIRLSFRDGFQGHSLQPFNQREKFKGDVLKTDFSSFHLPVTLQVSRVHL